MLFADKRALRTDLKLQLLEIREKELSFYTTNTLSIGTQAALFAGFSSTALMTEVDKSYQVLHTLFLLSTILGLASCLSTVVSTSLLVMVAPGLALRGPDGSMSVAVDNMIDEYRRAFRGVLFGIMMFHISTICYAWLTFWWPLAAVLSIGVSGSLYCIIRYIRVLMRRFALPAEAVVTGKFEGNEAQRAGQAAGLKNRGEISTLSTLIQEESRGRGIGPDGAPLAPELQRGLPREVDRGGRYLGVQRLGRS